MGAKKPLQAAGRQPGGVLRKTKTRLVPASISPQHSSKSRSTPSKLDKSIPVKKPESKETQSTKHPASSKTPAVLGAPKSLKKDSPASTSSSSLSNAGVTKAALSLSTVSTTSGVKSSSVPGTPNKTQHDQPAAQQQQQKPDEEKAKAINKMLKSLDIKISGFKNIVPEEQKSVECKASISEIVKTKSRAAAAKLTTGVVPKIAKKPCAGTQDTGKKVVTASKFVDKNKTSGDAKDEEKKSGDRRDEACQKTKESKDTSNARTQNVKKTEVKRVQAEEAVSKEEEKKITKTKEDTEKVAKAKASDVQGKAKTSLESSKVKSTEAQISKQLGVEGSKKKIKEARRESQEKQRVYTKQVKKGKKTPPDKKELKSGDDLNTAQIETVLEKNEENSDDKTESLSSKNIEKRSGGTDKLGADSSKRDDEPQYSKNTATKKILNKATKNQNQGTSSIKGEAEVKIAGGKGEHSLENTFKEKTSHSDSKEQSKDKSGASEISKPVSCESGGSTKKNNKPKLKNSCNEGPSPIKLASQVVATTTELKSDGATFREGEGEPPRKEPCSSGKKLIVPEKPWSAEKSKNLPEEKRIPSKEVAGNKNEQKASAGKTSQDAKPNSQESKVEKKENVAKASEQSEILPRSQLRDSDPSSATLPKDPSPKPSLSPLSQQSKLLSVRERLQKKYVQNRTITTGFRTFKLNKQPKPVKRSGKMKPQKTSKLDPKDERPEERKTEKKEKDIYDFKTESESDDNIKMNLLGQSSILSKIRIEKDFSDEDDKPLQLTKLQLKEEKEEKMAKRFGGAAKETETPPKAEKVADVEKEEKNPATPAKKSCGHEKKSVTLAVPPKEDKKPTRPAKKPTASSKRKERIESSDSSSSASDSESEESSSSSSRLRKSCFGPKRHRMASLNALAKVQCLYENESRTAHELGLSKTAQIPRIRLINSGSSSDEEKADRNKRELEIKEVKTEKDSGTVEVENKRELRNAPGLRGIGKHWDFNDVSSFESGHESDVTFRGRIDFKPKTKKRKVPKQKVTPVKEKERVREKEKSEQKPKKVVKTQKKKPTPQRQSSSESSDEEEEEGTKAVRESPQVNKKRKRDKSEDIGSDLKGVLARKRMASLNASALVAATYEVERHLDRNLNSDCSSFESFPEDEKPIAVNPPKKLKEIKKDKVEESSCKENKENKESSRPTSSSVVIVQDTDVTITGVYVNSSTGSSQEAYCKMQYRVQSSVTEERVLRPSSIDPPKSYTPLGALSSMRPPGATVPPEGQHPAPSQQQQQSVVPPPPPAANIYQSPTISQESPQHNPHIYPPTHHHPPSPTASAHQHLAEQQPPPPPLHHHHHHHPQPQLKYPSHLPHHHHHQQQPHQPTPLLQARCESPVRYQSGAYQVQAPVPAPPSLSMPGSGSSAFCAPMQQSHHDMSGKCIHLHCNSLI